jgi:methylthioribose-1-phosphate isomerase (EC 5.3.1.23)
MEDEDACRTMGELGLTLLEPGMGILTHCNAGTIATAKYGTALAPIYLGQERGLWFSGICRRNPASASGRPADCLGASEGGSGCDSDL